MCDWRHVITFSTIFFVFLFFFLSYRFSFVRDFMLFMISLCNRSQSLVLSFPFSIVSYCYLVLAVIYFFFPFIATNWTTDGRSRNVEEMFLHCIKTDYTSRFTFFKYILSYDKGTIICRYRRIIAYCFSHCSLLECK